MPFYEYECQKCGHQLEVMQKISDAPIRKCPHCGKLALRKLMSSPVFRLKGSGWYETDFKSDKEGKRNLADQPEREEKKDDKKPDEAAKSEPAKADAAETPAKADAKPDAKTATDAAPGAAKAPAGKASRSAPRTRRRTARRPK